MLYHTLLNMVEQHLPSVTALVQRAAVFRLDITPHKALDKTWNADKRERLMEHFRLPYPITAIEDQASCVILADIRSPQGLNAPRLYLECLPADAMSNENAFSDEFEDRTNIRDALQDRRPGSVIVHLGRLACHGVSNDGFLVYGDVAVVLGGTPDQLDFVRRDLDPEDRLTGPMCAAALKNAMTTLEEVVMVEDQPGFTGWPQDEHAVLNSIFDISIDGRIVPSDCCTRQRGSWRA